MVAGVFFYGEEPDPPPFPLTEQQASKVFGDRFELKTTERVTDSLSIFARQRNGRSGNFVRDFRPVRAKFPLIQPKEAK